MSSSDIKNKKEKKISSNNNLQNELLVNLLNRKSPWDNKKENKTAQKKIPQVLLSREMLKKIRQGEFWIYREQVKNFNELVSVFPHGGFLSLPGGGLALFDSENPIALRVLDKQNKKSDLKPYLKKVLLRATDIRKNFFPVLQKQNITNFNQLEEFTTTGIRLLHGENDFLPGLTADFYQGLLVYRLDSVVWFPLLRHIDNILKEQIPLLYSYVTSRYAKGWLTEKPVKENIFYFKENNLTFELDVQNGQKTGFFLDMRENRSWLANLCQNKKVLNAFSYTCAFSVYALRAEATSVTNIDISLAALEAGKRNHQLNHLPTQKQTVEFIDQDVLSWLQKIPTVASKENGKFDLIILDPPAYTHTQNKITNALHAYYKLNNEALLRLGSGQYLATASCSPRVSYDDFFATVVRAADDSKRKIRLLYSYGAGVDHPYAPNQVFSPYLKFLVFYVVRVRFVGA